MPTLAELKAANFDHFKYASAVTELLKNTFSEFQTVGWEPLRESGALSRYADVAVPAFLMAYVSPDFENLSPMQPMLDTFEGGLGETLMEDTGASFVQLRVRVSGVLLLPVNPAENNILKDDVKNIAIYEAAATACLVVALKTQTLGLQVSDVVIESIESRLEADAEETEIYRATEIIWSHEVVIGWKDSTTPFRLTKLFADIEQLTVGQKSGAEQASPPDFSPEKVVATEWEEDEHGNPIPKDTSIIAEWVPLPTREAPRYWLGFEGAENQQNLIEVYKIINDEWVKMSYVSGRWESQEGTWVEFDFDKRTGNYSILSEGENE